MKDYIARAVYEISYFFWRVRNYIKNTIIFRKQLSHWKSNDAIDSLVFFNELLKKNLKYFESKERKYPGEYTKQVEKMGRAIVIIDRFIDDEQYWELSEENLTHKEKIERYRKQQRKEFIELCRILGGPKELDEKDIEPNDGTNILYWWD